MNIIRLSIDRPAAVLAVVLMVVLFGFLALTLIPIQLIPDVRKPVIGLNTIWPGAAPAEVEREIVNRQEDRLRGLEGLQEITSESQDGRARVTLEFAVGQNMDKALLLVANRLDQVNGYPDEASEPFMRTAASEDTPIAWIILLRAPGETRDIHTFGDFVDGVVQDRLERVPGVARVNVYGGSTREMVVTVHPQAMARYGLGVSDTLTALRAANSSVSAGDVNEGKRRYVVRTEGQFDSLDDLRAVVLKPPDDTTQGLGRVTVGDIATVRFDYVEPVSRIRYNGQPALAINAVRETGANVIETMAGIRQTIAKLNASDLPAQGLILHQVYDETVYINSSIDLVRQNIFIGGTLAAFVLLIFLRSAGATLAVSIAIPVSVVGAFVAMAFMGRSLNVISLAGIAFAVGMVVDAAIIVLENIYRLRQQGIGHKEAAYQGAAQVWGAVLVSVMTTVVVFIPILIMDLEVGQLFRDIAVALSVSVLLSLVVAVTVIPTLSTRLLGSSPITRQRVPIVDDIAEAIVAAIVAMTRTVIRSRAASLAVVVGFSGLGVPGHRPPCCQSSNTCPTAIVTWCSASSCRPPATTWTRPRKSPPNSKTRSCRCWRKRANPWPVPTSPPASAVFSSSRRAGGHFSAPPPKTRRGSRN